MFSRSARSARLKTGPDRHFFGPNLADQTVQFSERARTERAKTERATSGPKSPLGTSTLSTYWRVGCILQHMAPLHNFLKANAFEFSSLKLEMPGDSILLFVWNAFQVNLVVLPGDITRGCM